MTTLQISIIVCVAIIFAALAFYGDDHDSGDIA
jgi:hypothetical protein